jgi:excisionase family DNA binding protein
MVNYKKREQRRADIVRTAGERGMRDQGAVQSVKTTQWDQRVIELCNHLRSAIDIFEQLASGTLAAEPSPQPISQASSVQAVEEEKLPYSVREVSKLLGIGRNTIYNAVNGRTLLSVKLGRRILIPSKGLRDWTNLQVRA